MANFNKKMLLHTLLDEESLKKQLKEEKDALEREVTNLGFILPAPLQPPLHSKKGKKGGLVDSG